MFEKIEESRKEEWEQLRKMSTSEFLSNHLESVSIQENCYAGIAGMIRRLYVPYGMQWSSSGTAFTLFRLAVLLWAGFTSLIFFTKIIIINWKLHSVQPKPEDYRYGSFAFMDEGCEMVAAFRGEIFRSIFRPIRKDRVQRCIKVMMKDLGGEKAIRDQDPGVSASLIKNTQTTSAAAVEQENMDVYFDSWTRYISELWGVELYQLFKFNKV